MPYTDVIFAFLVPDDNGNVQAVDAINEPDPQANIETLHSAGKNVLVSFGGATPTSSQYQQCAQDVSNVVQQIVSFVIENGFDGADIDFEDSSAFTSKALYSGVQFLVDLTNGLAQALPSGQNIITHAPQTPYWDPARRYNDAYSQIWAEVGDQITWINNQLYNNANYDPLRLVSFWVSRSQVVVLGEPRSNSRPAGDTRIRWGRFTAECSAIWQMPPCALPTSVLSSKPRRPPLSN